MALSDQLLKALTEGTRQFIHEDPEDIVFEPYAMGDDGLGGKLLQPDGMRGFFTETVRMIPQADAVPMARTSDGNIPVPTYIILGMPDAKFQRYDRFTYRGMSLFVNAVHVDPSYEKKGDAVSYG